MTRVRIGLVGAGKIARDQHLPAIAADGAFDLVGVVDPAASIEGVESYASLAEMIGEADPAAIAICTPTQVHHVIAREALQAGKHVLVEKPPTARVGELEDLAVCANRSGVTLFTAWHSQFAPAVPAAREWLVAHRPRRIMVDWREDVRRWHPGQNWIWEAGGFGVFDPGINALSILTSILDEAAFVKRCVIEVPENRREPIAATMSLATGGGADIQAVFDWRHTGVQTWDIAVTSEDGEEMALGMGGHRISTGSVSNSENLGGEYPAMYRHFAALIADGRSDVDADPLRLVADAYQLAERRVVEPFIE